MKDIFMSYKLKDMLFKTLFVALPLIACPTVTLSAQKTATQKDSITVATLYEQARLNSDRNPKEAKIYLYELIDYIDSIHIDQHPSRKYFIERKATALHFLSYFERRETNFEKSATLAQKSIDLKIKYGLDSLLATSYLQKAKTWQVMFLNEEALILLKKADSVAQRYQQKSQLLEIYSSLGSTFNALKDTVNAKRYYKKSIHIADSIGSKYQKAIAYSNYASFLRLINKYEENLPYLEKAIALHRENNNKIGLESGLYALGLHYNKTGSPEKAIPYIKQAINLGEELKSYATLPFRYKELSKSYKELQDYKSALKYQELYREALEERNDIRDVKRMAQVEKELQFQKQKVADSVQYAQNKILFQTELKHKTRTRILHIAIAFLLIIGGAIFYSIRTKQKAREQAYQNILLNNKIATKTEEINELLTETVQHIKSKERIAENLSKLAKFEEGITLKSILADLNVDKVDDSKLLLLKENISEANYDFIKTLKEQYPDLSKTDIEICTFLKIGLDRNQIAKLRNTSIEAVRKSRHRIRKKLDLDDEIDLESFLTTLS